MAGGWAYSGEPASLGSAGVTLVEGSSFIISEPTGDVRPGTPQGLFVLDTRVLSRWELTVDDARVESLTVMSTEPWFATFVCRAAPRPGRSDSTLLVRRDRYVGRGLREDITLENLGGETAAVRLSVTVEADFADLFEVKESRVPDRLPPEISTSEGALRLTRHYPTTGSSRGVEVSCVGATATRTGLLIDAVVPARSSWTTVLQVQPVVEGTLLPSPYPTDHSVERSTPAQQAKEWRRSAPVVRTENVALARTMERTRVDLGALRIFDPDDPDSAVLAAGAPWFMTLFGRDSLLTSYMVLPVDPSLAFSTVHTLARLQGTKVDPASEEEPGRILHEVRFGADPALAIGGRQIYYGTADATPLFVVLLGELRRWGLAEEEAKRLLPHADRALEWVLQYGDRDGDGFVEYQRATDRGLVNQGWKDSWDGVPFADGRLARPPIALCEVQGYTYGAFLARSHFAWELGDEVGQRVWAERAARLKAAFNERFWLPEKGWYALALDADKQPVDALASNMGHCLWSGIVDEDKAPLVVERLMSEEMFSGWGVRTLGTSMGAYNPMSYHNGSVWPHDNAIITAGLMRYGFVAEAQRVASAMLDAAEAFGGRLPELFCGFDRKEFARPVPFPTSCSPQAWASATPVQLLRTLLRFDPWVPHGKAWLAPALPEELGRLVLDNVPLGGARVSLDVEGDRVLRIDGAPDSVEIIREPRVPTSAAVQVAAGG